MISSQIRVLLISVSWVLLMLHLKIADCNPLNANCTGNCLSSTLQPNLTSVPTYGGNHSTKAPHEDAQHKSHGGIKVAKFDFERVKTPFVVCLWILIASLAKIGRYANLLISNTGSPLLRYLLGIYKRRSIFTFFYMLVSLYTEQRASIHLWKS